MNRRGFMRTLAGGVAAAVGISLAPEKPTRWLSIDPAAGPKLQGPTFIPSKECLDMDERWKPDASRPLSHLGYFDPPFRRTIAKSWDAVIERHYRYAWGRAKWMEHLYGPASERLPKIEAYEPRGIGFYLTPRARS